MKHLSGIIVAALTLLAGEALAQGKTEVLWLGQSAVRITSPGGKVIVIDPYLSKNPKTPAAWKDPAALGKVDLVLVTHAHGDHLGDAPQIVKANNAPLWAPQGLSASLAALGIVPAKLANRMGPGGSITPFGPGGIRITMVHAEHNSELVWENPATGKREVHYGGQPCGFVIQMENGFRIYHTGDTGLFGDMKLIGEYYKPDLVLIPVGGGPAVINPVDAAYATREFLKPRFAIPIHYATNPLLAGTPKEFIDALGSTPTKVIVMNPGDKVEF
ncbi:MAG TPA: metal-dependent hydrolase [Burkholderiales bacterium]|nr:metal-dependent hydrolase [Burkholderiales bacterium]